MVLEYFNNIGFSEFINPFKELATTVRGNWGN